MGVGDFEDLTSMIITPVRYHKWIDFINLMYEWFTLQDYAVVKCSSEPYR